MLKLDLEFRTPKAIIKDGKPFIEYDVVNEQHIVASTKSQNNLIDDLKTENKIATSVIVTDIFVNKATIETALAAIIGKEIEDKKTAEFITDHMVKALDGACVFKREPITRKKA